MNEQEKYLAKIQKLNHMPTFTYLEKIDPGQKKGRPGKRFNVGKYKLADHRTVGSNEVIWDLDYTGYSNNYKIAKEIIKVLDNRGWHYNIFSTGGKGIHISMWFDKVNFADNDKLKELFKEALSYGLTTKQIRIWIWEIVLKEANVWNGKTEKDKELDTNPLSFREEQGKFHAIRLCGGRKIVMNDIINKAETTYKTWIPLEEFKRTKVTVKNIDQVRFPEEIKLSQLDQFEFADFLNIFLTNAKNKKTPQQQNIKLEGTSYVELQSVKAIIEGLQEGSRAMGARIIAIACKLDGFNEEKAKILMKEYVDNCSQIGSQFTIEECNHWIEWVYQQPEHFWNCSLVKELGVHDTELCEYCRQSKKEVYEVLENKNLLKRIDKYLASKIVGEEKTRILTFLLMLSSKFKVIEGRNNGVKPASVIFSSASASGKSYVTKAILPLFGKEGTDYYIFSRMTKQSLNYFSEIDMNDKIMFIEELQGLDADSNQLRLWISEGQLKLSSPESVKMPDGTERKVLTITKTKGQPMFITGTAEDQIDEQMNNRSWLVSLDISKEQNKKILAFEDWLAQGVMDNSEEELRILQDSIKELRTYKFIIPFFNHETLNIPVDDVRIRRDYQKLKYMICCSGLLHQKQRYTFKDKNDVEYLVCNFDDYETAKYYSEDALRATFSGLTNAQIDLSNRIKEASWATKEFTCEEVQRMTGWAQSKTWTMLNQLDEVGVITSSGRGDGGRGHTVNYHYNFDKELLDLMLPKTKDLMQKFAEEKPEIFEEMSKKPKLLLSSETRKYSSLLKGNKNPKMDKNSEKNEKLSTINYLKFFNMSKIRENQTKLSKEIEHSSDSKMLKNNVICSSDTKNEIVYATEKNIIKSIKNYKNIMMPIADLKWDNVDELITKMKHDGIILEPKPGMVMLL